jgi:hypothetical protein
MEGESDTTTGEHEQVNSGTLRTNARRGIPANRDLASDVHSVAGRKGESNTSLAGGTDPQHLDEAAKSKR